MPEKDEDWRPKLRRIEDPIAEDCWEYTTPRASSVSQGSWWAGRYTSRAAALVLPGPDRGLHPTLDQTDLWHGACGFSDERDDLRPKVFRGELRGSAWREAHRLPAVPRSGSW